MKKVETIINVDVLTCYVTIQLSGNKVMLVVK